MDKYSFLTIVTDVMKEMVSREKMMASLQRSGMRANVENLELMKSEEDNVDKLIGCMDCVKELDVSDDILDALVLRYFRNTSFLSKIKELEIDVSCIDENEISYWKKTMLYRAPDTSPEEPKEDME